MDDKTALAFIVILVLINLGLFITRVDSERELEKMKQDFKK